MEFSKDDLEIILWEFIGHQLEELSVFKALSANLVYLNREKLDMVDSSEIQDSDGLTILDLQQNDRELLEYGEKLISDLELHYRDIEGSEHYR